MKALFYTGTEQMELRDTNGPIAEPGQCIVDLAFCGLCGSDMHAWHGHDARRVPPLILGHEAVGVVRDGTHAGRRVAINRHIHRHAARLQCNEGRHGRHLRA